ncbi:ABC transporter ATP-binding protein [Iamia sp. SCSIO 61187]|uniref:ABC transporter ATP-binding protein n=1 Tax=Iamia sp. SCSIO 61187 TaxID=2722752 RepID=UPI001C631B41|nr:ABC transporter ATP-binding protein [Iamia sp. SCSIO 61187]QYG94766.1 ABC transporter ATP-binding protein [Iamia sp. SCSIO 61187]
MLSDLIRTHLRPYKRPLLLLLVLQIVQAGATLVLPTINADIIDKGVVPGDDGYVRRLGAVMLAVAIVQVVFNVAAIRVGARVATAFGRDVRHSIFHSVTRYSAREVGELGPPSLITRITNDVQQVQMLVVMSLTILAAAPITIVVGTFMAVREDGPLSLLLLVAVPALVLGVGTVVLRMIPQFQAIQEKIDRVNAVLREQIVGIRVVRAFGREPHEAERFSTANAELTMRSLNAGRLMAFMFPIVFTVLNTSSVAAVWFGAGRIDSGDMQIGALIAFLSYLIQILMAVMMGTFVAVMTPRAQVCAERIQEVLRKEPTVADAPGALTELPEHPTLELRDVGFHYPGAEAPVLGGVRLTVAPGTTTAIIGSTGSGKTTLLNLIPRLFDATEGAVLVGGTDIREVETEALWRRIGLVPQKPYLFSGTVGSNIRLGAPDATDGEVWAALETSQARGFVEAMGGLDARIEQGGSNVSGGQRQRLAIARAVVRRPAIYLFDDSFSALDLATDARLRAALAPAMAEAAMVVVAQRVSTIIGADQILVLEDGRPVGLGPHDELVRTCPTYAEIVASQATTEAAA